MTERISPAQFHAVDGLADWRIVFTGASARFRTTSWVDAVALVAAIGQLTLDSAEPPRVDLRPDGVLVRLSVPTEAGLRLSDIDTARAISDLARKVGATSQPEATQVVQFTIDALVSTEVMPFWRAVLGYVELGPEDLVDPNWSGPNIWFQDQDEPRSQRNRIHVDVSVPPEVAPARIGAALAAGGRLVRDRGPSWWTLADAEGNEIDIATWQGRG